MRAVFTYYTDNGNKLAQNWPKFSLFAHYFYLSVLSAVKYFDEVVIYTDAPNIVYNLFSDEQEIKVLTLDYNKQSRFKKGFWNFPKLVTYFLEASRNEPFLHIDNDFILNEKPKNLDAPIVCEATRYSFEPTWKFRELGIEPKDHNIKTAQKILCSGVLGGNNLEAFKTLMAKAEQVQAHVLENKLSTVRYAHLYIMEEYLLTGIVGIESVKTIDCKYQHLQGKKKLQNSGNEKNKRIA